MRFFYVFVGVLVLASCHAHVKHPKAPKHPKVKIETASKGAADNRHAPGQIKKVTGSKSAKPYAPGQRKKHNPHGKSRGNH